MPMDITPELSLLLFRVRDRIYKVLEDPYYTPRTTTDGNRTGLIIQLRNWFPDTYERDIRLAILEAFMAHPVSTQNELSQQITNILKEVTKDDSRYLTRELCTQLQDAVESLPHGEAWLLPATNPESMAVSDLSGRNTPEPEHGFA